MKKLGWILLIIAIAVVIIYWKQSKIGLAAIAPKQCMFHVDDNWSSSFQQTIIHSVNHCYQASKNPDSVISTMTTQFPEIGCVHAQICSADKICFHIDGIQPVFLLNDTYVVTATGHMSSKKDFSKELQCALPIVLSDQLGQLPQMVDFVQKLSSEITSLHTITWQNNDMIILSPRDETAMQCVACTTRVPVAADTQRCHELYQELLTSKLTKKSKKKMMIYDIRFKNQIIVRPGG